eukprot:377268-Pelagomonas_calceolata.AAC.1
MAVHLCIISFSADVSSVSVWRPKDFGAFDQCLDLKSRAQKLIRSPGVSAPNQSGPTLTLRVPD